MFSKLLVLNELCCFSNFRGYCCSFCSSYLVRERFYFTYGEVFSRALCILDFCTNWILEGVFKSLRLWTQLSFEDVLYICIIGFDDKGMYPLRYWFLDIEWKIPTVVREVDLMQPPPHQRSQRNIANFKAQIVKRLTVGTSKKYFCCWIGFWVWI